MIGILFLFGGETGGKVASDFWLTKWSGNSGDHTVVFYLGNFPGNFNENS